MSAPSDRRGFLRGLATLPLIGGGVSLIGNPTRAAEPVTDELLQSYNSWLFMERRMLLEEMQGGFDSYKPNTPGWMFHWRAFGAPELPAPSTGAAVVLSSVGCDWRAPLSSF